MENTLIPELASFMEETTPDMNEDNSTAEDSQPEETSMEFDLLVSDHETSIYQAELIYSKMLDGYNTLSYISKYGLNEHVAFLSKDTINWNLFFNKDIIGTEDFNNDNFSSCRNTAICGLESIGKNIWDFICKIAKKISDFFKKIYNYLFGTRKKSQQTAEKAKESTKKIENTERKTGVKVSRIEKEIEVKAQKSKAEHLEDKYNEYSEAIKKCNQKMRAIGKRMVLSPTAIKETIKSFDEIDSATNAIMGKYFKSFALYVDTAHTKWEPEKLRNWTEEMVNAVEELKKKCAGVISVDESKQMSIREYLRNNQLTALQHETEDFLKFAERFDGKIANMNKVMDQWEDEIKNLQKKAEGYHNKNTDKENYYRGAGSDNEKVHNDTVVLVAFVKRSLESLRGSTLDIAKVSNMAYNQSNKINTAVIAISNIFTEYFTTEQEATKNAGQKIKYRRMLEKEKQKQASA